MGYVAGLHQVAGGTAVVGPGFPWEPRHAGGLADYAGNRHPWIAAALRRRPTVSHRRYGGGVPDGTRTVKRRNHTVNGSYLTRFADNRGLLAGIELSRTCLSCAS